MKRREFITLLGGAGGDRSGGNNRVGRGSHERRSCFAQQLVANTKSRDNAEILALDEAEAAQLLEESHVHRLLARRR